MSFWTLPGKTRSERIMGNLREAHAGVLDAYSSFGISTGPVPIIVTSQETLQTIRYEESAKFDIPFHDAYINGMYVRPLDVIMSDSEMLYAGHDADRVLAHEYAHRLFDIVMLGRRRKGGNNQPPLLAGEVSSGAKQDTSLQDALDKYVEALEKAPQVRRTGAEKRRMEFNIYFEEMFAESTARFLTGRVEDHPWLACSRFHQGDMLGQDSQFSDALERALYKRFFDNMFTYGIRRVTAELPIIYGTTRWIFERRYRNLLSSTFHL